MQAKEVYWSPDSVNKVALGIGYWVIAQWVLVSLMPNCQWLITKATFYLIRYTQKQIHKSLVLHLWCQIWFPISYILALNMTQVRWLTKHHKHVISNTLESEIQVNFVSRYHPRIRWSLFFRVALTTNILHLPPLPFSYFSPLCLFLTLSSHSPHKWAFSLDVRGEGARDVCVGGYLFPFFSDPDCCHSVYFCLSACTGLWERNWDILNRTLLSHYHYQRRPRLYLGLSLPRQFWRGGPGSKVSECSSIEFICFRFVVCQRACRNCRCFFLLHRRGKPLFLSQERFNRLEEQWLTHSFDHMCKRWKRHLNTL